MSVPDGYVVGLNREPGADQRYHAHLYKGTFNDVGDPMCWRGWNRDDGMSYSIWRGNYGLGVCKTCLRRAEAGLPPVEPELRPRPERPALYG